MPTHMNSRKKPRANNPRKFVKQSKNIDNKLLVLTLILTFVGLVAVADASAPMAVREFGDKFYFAKQQAYWATFGVLILLVFSKIKYSYWGRIAIFLYVIAIAALVMVFIPGFGAQLLGAKRWVFIGPLSFQPSEFAKMALMIYLAKVAEKDKKTLAYFVPIGIVAGLILLQPDLGTTIVTVGAGLVQVFVAGASLLHLAGAGVVGVLGGMLVILTSEYRRDRLLTFLSQTEDPLGKSYHIRQIILALGAGGIFGVGLGQSRQKYLFLPETATDSIFAVIAEELGFLGASIIIICFMIFVFRAIKIASLAPDKFSKVLASGIVAWIGGQALLNIGSMVAVVPLTGIPLPFLSYGGSSLIMVLAATGILLNISRYTSVKK